MNNLRLLAGLACVALLGGGMRAQGQQVMTLEEIFRSADAGSAWLRPSMAAQSEAERETSVARASRLPDINVSLSVSHIGDGFTTDRSFGDYQRAPIPHLGTGLSLTVEQPVFTGGAITNSIALARMKSKAATLATELTRDNIRLELARCYLEIFRQRGLRGVVESSISSARKVLAEMKARYEQGTALLNDITRYELLVSNLELQLVRIDNTMKILNDNLVKMAALPDGTVVIPDSTILDRAMPAQSESRWQEDAAAGSPSLALARSGLDISRRAEALARADMYPKIGIKVGWTIDGPILVEVPPINRNLSYWYVGVGVSYSLSSLFKTNKSLAKSRAATLKAARELELADRETSLAVNADYIRYLESYEELKTQQKSVELAERNYRTISVRYAEGMALITDMLDAADSRLDARQKLVDARINIIFNYYKLLFTTGKI